MGRNESGSGADTRQSTARNGCATTAQTGRAFRRIDAILDRSNIGPLWLKDPRVAQCIVDALLKGATDLQFFKLHAFVVMPNHVHALLTPCAPMRRITNGLKGSTARHANLILSRTNHPFWQDESFDHWVRSGREFQRIWAYIESNPVSASLADKPEAWPWSSVSFNLPRL